ncbi:MAG TPA: response regulator [Pseudolabrys sp.]|nr:response regulator [Pseudolabrys sp.]
MAPIAVLLVEDEAMISELVADALSEQGFAVHEAATGNEALRYIDSGAAIDVLFTDVNLPGGIDGTELAIRVRELRPDLPIVYASGRYNAAGLGRMVTRSVFVAKPYNPSDVGILLARLTEGLGVTH